MRKSSQDFYPLFLRIKGRRCLVVGGGEVALRKVRTLLGHGASVEVISPEPSPELEKLAEGGELRLLRRGYQAGDLEGAIIAVAATDDSQINRQVVKEAKERAVLVNIADDLDSSDFILPSYLRRGDITIAVSTGGVSPALARKIRSRLEKDFGGDYASLVRLVGEVRAELRRRKIKISGDDWQQALDLDLILSLLKKGEEEKARAFLLENLTGTKR
jgi:precorrin-2 dehydrogenase/sirohydrochlorin ferrochelatase